MPHQALVELPSAVEPNQVTSYSYNETNIQKEELI